MTNLQHLNGSGSNIANFTNTYDLASRITSETLNGAPTTYSYDITNQLTDDTLVTYAYDLNGNRLTTGTFTYSTAGANQLASDGIWNYFYDQNGNLIQKVNISTGEVFAFGYDNRNRMITVTDTRLRVCRCRRPIRTMRWGSGYRRTCGRVVWRRLRRWRMTMAGRCGWT